MSVVRWQAWRKRKDQQAFTKVDGCIHDTKAGCYTLLMEMTELRGQEPLQSDLLILPEGDFPRPQTYRDRMMRPGV